MMTLWIKGLVKHRMGRLAGAMAGVALTVALLLSLGTFISESSRLMTQKAIQSVPVDWQILLAAGADVEAVKKAVADTTAYTAMHEVSYADVTGFVSNTGGTTQTTGAGKVLGIPTGYHQDFPAEIRALLGSMEGVVVAQQTASNLHVTVGDTVTIQRIGLPPVDIKIDGIVDLPQADSLFQAVGVPAGTAPQAPPDNVILLPDQQFHQVFDSQTSIHANSVKTQLHVRISHQLPSDPNGAYAQVLGLAHHLEASVAGSAAVGDNLVVRLDGVRSDALFSRTVFLFLGLPGALLAVLLTVAISNSGSHRRRQEQALLRTRGASLYRIVTVQGTESIIIAIGGIFFGIVVAYLASRYVASTPFIWNPATRLWLILASVIGLALSVFSVVYPVWRDAKKNTVANAKVNVARIHKPLWRQLYLDIVILLVSATFFWRAASSGYQLVLAPEGVVNTSVNYEQFVAPLGLWIGGALFFMRIWSISLERGSRLYTALFRPFAGDLSHVVASSLVRQRTLIARGLILVALAFSFAVSTSVFNTTYNAQSRVDAELTNGSDVNITGTTQSAPDAILSELKKLPGVSAIQPMQHRFAYVGNDLQDLYGIDPQHIGEVSTMSNAYFGNKNAKQSLAQLAATVDGIFLSEETINDYQLHVGDRINLRLQNFQDHQYHTVPFHLVGMVKEFPTAPKDSFLVANADYIAKQTGTNASEIVLIRTNGDPGELVKRVQPIAQSLSGARVTDLGSVQKTISSSLTAVNLQGLSRLETAFAILMVAGFTGLIFALGLSERRRTFAILSALGATKKQLGYFIWSEGWLILIGGGICGIGLGFGIAEMFVKVLTGVFDPPPESLRIPVGYLAVLIVISALTTVLAVYTVRNVAQSQVIKALRNPNLYF